MNFPSLVFVSTSVISILSIILNNQTYKHLIIYMGQILPTNTKETKSEYFTSLREQGKNPKIGIAAQQEELISSKERLKALQNQQSIVKIENKDSYPFGAIGRIQAFYAANQSTQWSTGCLVKGDIVLTCAHNCYNRSQSTRAKSIWFYPSYNSQSTEENRIKVIKIYYPNQFEDLKTNDKNNDYAFLLLQKNVQNRFGFLGIDFYSQVSQGNKYILGYPIHGIIFHNKDANILHICKGQTQPKNGFLIHKMQTNSGMGGGPIVQIKNGEIFVIGVHSFGSHNTGEKGGIKLTKTIKSKFNQQMPKIDIEINMEQMLKKDKAFNDFIKQDCSKVSILKLNMNKIDTKRIRDISKINFICLRELELKSNLIDEIGVQQLIKIQWQYLQRLQLSDNPIKWKGVNQLINHKWINLTKLSLSKCDIKDKGAKIFFAHNWQTLLQIDLSRNNITSQGLIDCNKSPSMGNLQSINLSYNQLYAQGVNNLVKGNFQSLASLGLKCNHLQSGVIVLAKLTWSSLKKLDIGQNQIQNKDLKEFSNNDWGTLQQIILQGNRITDEGIQTILRIKWPSLKSINLQMNRISVDNMQQYRGQLKKILGNDSKVLI